MNVTSTLRRVVATSGITALAAAALVGGTTTAANADPAVTNTYTCTGAGQTFPISVLTNAPGIENFESIGAGAAIPGGLLSVTNVFTIPGAVYDFMAGAGVSTVSAPTYTGSFGDTAIGVDGVSITLAGMTQNDDGSWTSSLEDADMNGLPDEGTGLNQGFEVPAAGEYDILSPTTLDLVATLSNGGEVPVSCTIAEGTEAGAYHHILVTKNVPTVSGSAVAKSLKTTEVAKLKVTVAAPHTPTGKVVVKEGKKTLGDGMLKNGKVTVKLGKLSKGEHTVKIQYKGDGYTKAGAGTATFTVKQG